MALADNLAVANLPPALNLNIKVSHQYMATQFEQQAFYVLVDITHTPDLPKLRLPLNLAVVLDTSTSMQGVRLQQAKQGVQQIIDQLTPEDAFSLITFSDKAKVLLPSERHVDKARSKAIVSTIQSRGGTEMLQGLLAGMQELGVNRTPQSVNHLIFLTDGQTYGDEAACLEKSEWAGVNKISFTTLGVGADWNETLLDQMAMASGGSSIYIDSPREIAEVFKTTMHTLTLVVARELSAKLELSLGVNLVEAFQITPYITRVNFNSPAASLGSLAANNSKTLLLEFRVQAELCQSYDYLMKLNVEGDIPSQMDYQNWEAAEIKANFTSEPAKNTEIPSVIVTALGKLAIFKLQEKAMIDLEHGEVVMATQRLETMATRLLNMGESDLARSALLEAGRLARSGNLSAEGRKKIRYGTRNLSVLPKEINRD